MDTKHLSDLADLYAAHIKRGLFTVASRAGVHNKTHNQQPGDRFDGVLIEWATPSSDRPDDLRAAV